MSRITAPPQDFTQATDPFALFDAWFAEAAASEPNDPNAMALATVDPGGLPNVRMVLLKGFEEPGAANAAPVRSFVFYSNYQSAKGQELLASGKAALLFHWKSLGRQVRIRGPVSQVAAEDADAYFASRPRLSQIGAWASAQSRPLQSRAALEGAVDRYTDQFHDRDVPRPPHWSGFRLPPVEIEFWHNRPFRLHDRLVFRRDPAASQWTMVRLYP